MLILFAMITERLFNLISTGSILIESLYGLLNALRRTTVIFVQLLACRFFLGFCLSKSRWRGKSRLFGDLASVPFLFAILIMITSLNYSFESNRVIGLAGFKPQTLTLLEEHRLRNGSGSHYSASFLIEEGDLFEALGSSSSLKDCAIREEIETSSLPVTCYVDRGKQGVKIEIDKAAAGRYKITLTDAFSIPLNLLN
ncbi:MAG: hypothetical protein K2X27_11620 [Candidatus Obscuribacterales bacterium]|nr:hypothetical protein [Candidatus Obscuribacterales bacterium]